MRASRFIIICLTLLSFKFNFSLWLTIMCLPIIIRVFTLWIRDMTRERGFQGFHNSLVQRGLKWGLVWFLFREVWFFFRIFWGFFHIRIAPVSGGIWIWPDIGLEVIPAFQVPLLNTIILLIRGVTATLAHQEILEGKKSWWLPISALLGFYFLRLQGIEYFASSFSISSGSYGRVFFFGTGFHGLHVCLGIIILTISSIRTALRVIRGHHHFRLEFSLWYWHFVDVVWLFLFFFGFTLEGAKIFL